MAATFAIVGVDHTDADVDVVGTLARESVVAKNCGYPDEEEEEDDPDLWDRPRAASAVTDCARRCRDDDDDDDEEEEEDVDDEDGFADDRWCDRDDRLVVGGDDAARGGVVVGAATGGGDRDSAPSAEVAVLLSLLAAVADASWVATTAHSSETAPAEGEICVMVVGQTVLFLLLGGAAFVGCFVVTDVPYKRQVTDYACGAASTQMLLAHRGVTVDQRAILDVLRTDTQVGTLSYDMTRAAAFSFASKAQSDLFPNQLPTHGWVGHPMGAAGFSRRAPLGTVDVNDCWIDLLEETVNSGFPVAILMAYESPGEDGHFRVVVGWDDDTIITLDPWDRNTPHRMDYSFAQFCALWNYTEATNMGSYGPFFGSVLSPWEIVITFYEESNTTILQADIRYPQPPSLGDKMWDSLKSTQSEATVQLPAVGMSLVGGQSQTVPISIINPGDTASVEWVLQVEQQYLETPPAQMTVEVVAQGQVSGTVPAVNNFPAYTYHDFIGGRASIIYA
ncbi:C39 family peptidase [Pelomyxa schiedti]|nr:C39 family peptidase [Pelomyxa schiedti]